VSGKSSTVKTTVSVVIKFKWLLRKIKGTSVAENIIPAG
tara:strand:+ start:328 stop:444 length:117 start_codon:yes stop_codon:yes gene_type:complete